MGHQASAWGPVHLTRSWKPEACVPRAARRQSTVQLPRPSACVPSRNAERSGPSALGLLSDLHLRSFFAREMRVALSASLTSFPKMAAVDLAPRATRLTRLLMILSRARRISSPSATSGRLMLLMSMHALPTPADSWRAGLMHLGKLGESSHRAHVLKADNISHARRDTKTPPCFSQKVDLTLPPPK